MTDEEFAAHRRQKRNALKLKYRREAGAVPRVEIAAAAAAKRVAVAERQAITQLHDAHVTRYDRVLYSRVKALTRYKSQPEQERERCAKNNKKRKVMLAESYVKELLKNSGIPPSAISQELIKLKRELMEYRRLSRTIKSTVKTHLKEKNEAID